MENHEERSFNYDQIYFIGIGGIGMSNLARYFLSQGKLVGGYDRTESALTEQLRSEGAYLHYNDKIDEIPAAFTDRERTLVVYTPAVPASHGELTYFRLNGFRMMKRAELLGEITRASDAICVAGTHGKTTVSSMTAHLLRQSHVDCNAFLGGILKNYNTNLLLSEQSKITVAEADEYDRSFHWLRPHIAIITSADPDHLDIYGTAEAYRESFEHFTSLIRPGGTLLLKIGTVLTPKTVQGVNVRSYSESEGDYHADNIRIGDGEIRFDYVSPGQRINDINLGVPVKINIENSVAAMAAAELCGATADEMRKAMASFAGARRRFDFHIKSDRIVFIDDYAHHPRELTAAIESIKALYPERKLTALFQPHLYSRTRDFADQFAESLSLADEVILLDIYPAREEPIEGVTSGMLLDRITLARKQLCSKEGVLDCLRNLEMEVLVTFGAGDIDRLLPAIEKMLRERYLMND
ncbi:UDP-N-acetylmuramate--L-alanine ligase [Dysgonomonadaceae bacterium zrk40]|nr:UDP-N-acetylmuramate--L-alanine ligase [Dysgonomonadaceae bacterium zrk40]